MTTGAPNRKKSAANQTVSRSGFEPVLRPLNGYQGLPITGRAAVPSKGCGGVERWPTASEGSRSTLCENVRDHFPGDIGQSKITTAVTVRKLGVVDAEQVQNGRVDVVDVDGLVDGLEAEVVRGAVDGASLDAAAGESHREPERIVIAAVGRRRRFRDAERNHGKNLNGFGQNRPRMIIPGLSATLLNRKQPRSRTAVRSESFRGPRTSDPTDSFGRVRY